MIKLDLQKIALIGAYLSFLWFIPLLFISRKSFDWKIKKLRMFVFLPTIGAYLFVIGIAMALFLDKDYISFGLNQFNILVITFMFLQSFVVLFMEISLNLHQKRLLNNNLTIRKTEMYLSLGLTILFSLDVLVRFEIYRLTF